MTGAKTILDMPGVPPAWLKKRTMIKDRVGSVRTTSFELPEASHVYGKAEEKDAEGCGVIMGSWNVSIPSKPKESQRSFVKTNKFALKEGCITAKTQRDFAQAHQDIRFKQPSGKQGVSVSNEPPFKGPYGMVTEISESIQPLIEADFTDWVDDAIDYPDLSAIEKKRRLKAPKATKASQGHDVRTKPPPSDKTPFKLKRFSNVPGKLKLPQ